MDTILLKNTPVIVNTGKRRFIGYIIGHNYIRKNLYYMVLDQSKLDRIENPTIKDHQNSQVLVYSENVKKI